MFAMCARMASEFAYVSRTTHLVSSSLKNQSYWSVVCFALGDLKSAGGELLDLGEVAGCDVRECRGELDLLHLNYLSRGLDGADDRSSPWPIGVAEGVRRCALHRLLDDRSERAPGDHHGSVP